MKKSTSSYEELQEQIITLIADRQFTAAINLIEINIRSYPNSDWLVDHYITADAAESQEQITALIANRKFTRAMWLIKLKLSFKVYPNNNWLMRHYGVALCSLGQKEEALVWFDKALGTNPDDYESMCERG